MLNSEETQTTTEVVEEIVRKMEPIQISNEHSLGALACINFQPDDHCVANPLRVSHILAFVSLYWTFNRLSYACNCIRFELSLTVF
jgi:hypothetical protein